MRTQGRYSFDPLRRLKSSLSEHPRSYCLAAFVIQDHAHHPRARDLWKGQDAWGPCWHLSLKNKMKLSQGLPRRNVVRQN